MRETRPSGSVEGVMSNRDPYSDSKFAAPKIGATEQQETTLISRKTQRHGATYTQQLLPAKAAIGMPALARPPGCLVVVNSPPHVGRLHILESLHCGRITRVRWSVYHNQAGRGAS